MVAVAVEAMVDSKAAATVVARAAMVAEAMVDSKAAATAAVVSYNDSTFGAPDH